MSTHTKSLDRKLQALHDNPGSNEFILADAKDADMAHGLAATGKNPGVSPSCTKFRSLQEYRDLIRQNVEQGLVDIMLMSASTNEVLTLLEGLFQNSAVTPAIRANDTTDVWLPQGGAYASQPSRPFRSASLDHALYGRLTEDATAPMTGADLGLYSITFNNDLDRDLATLNAYAAFRQEAERKGFRHFLEVFDPNAAQAPVPDVPRFVNDSIIRTLAGITSPGRPIFLKIVYHGPAALEQLVAYDSNLIVGIMGGSSGTTFDAFQQLWEARKYGARVALYGRMINASEHQLSFIQHLRWIADGQINDIKEAVKSYHAALNKLNIPPLREINEDLQQTLTFD